MLAFYTLYFDGACGPKNPGGTASYGWELHTPDEMILSNHGVVGTGPGMSNNVAEYAGLLAGLREFDAQTSDENRRVITLQVRGDSQLVINQMSGKWRAKGGLYYAWHELTLQACKELRKTGIKITFDWIPREMNTRCDRLSKMLYHNDIESQPNPVA